MKYTKLWYAVLADENDNDWGTGSETGVKALRIAERLGENAYVAVIDVSDDDPLCIAEIHRNEDGVWEPRREHYQF